MVQVPVARNYQSPLVSVEARLYNDAPEGKRMVPCEIDWGSMGGPNFTVQINLQNNATAPISQIVALSVDNSDCGADVRFIFPDTGETTTIPAYSPKTIIEVFTNQVQFYVQAGFNSEAVLAADTTRFSVLNFLPPPIAVPITEEQNSQSVNGIPADGATTATILANTISGTLEAIVIQRVSPITGTGTQTYQIQDSTGKIIAAGSFDASVGQSHNDILLNLNPMKVRFSGGLRMFQGGAAVGGQYCINILYRTP